jgi:EAL domain-containing protein (putative c-di-GMP-specific phosphodiesterase class I)/GGDEF domain-containing protein
MASTDTHQTLAKVIVARHAQIHVRLGLSLAVAIVFHPLTGPTVATVWYAIYALLQFAEYRLFADVDDIQPLKPWHHRAFIGTMALSNFAFATFGLLECVLGGIWGILSAGLLWCGIILNGAMVSGASRLALATSITPPTLYFLIMPYFVAAHGGTWRDSTMIVAAGVLNALTTVTIWAAGRRLLESVAHAKETARLAMLEPESGLPSRRATEHWLAELKAKDNKGVVVVAAIGIDRFLLLRDAIGHALMVLLVRAIADRFVRALPDIRIARISADMFGLVWTTCSVEDARHTMARLRQVMAEPLIIGGTTIDASVTIGLSEAASDTAAVGLSALDRAITAIEQGRQNRQPIAMFDPDAYGNPASNLSLMSEMARAFQNGEMDVHYQPKLDLRCGTLVGAEALIRWNHPERGALRPDMFVAMAEETGHIAALTEFVVRRVLADQRRLEKENQKLPIAINLSGRLIDDQPFMEKIAALITQAVAPICLEVTETSIIGNPQLARQTLEMLRAKGITISIDDYGSGLSSLAYLKNIPADELKIDKTFVTNIAVNTTDAMLVQSAIHLAHSLGLTAVAEGVETPEALSLLAMMGCNYAQGYWIARPMPFADLAVMLKNPPQHLMPVGALRAVLEPPAAPAAQRASA